MSSRGTSRYKKSKRTTISIPEQTPRTTAHIQSTTGRVSTGTIVDRSRYHKRPTLKKEEVEEDGLSIQSIGGAISTGTKAVTQTVKTVTLKIPKTSTVKKAGRRGVAPGVSTAVGLQEQKSPPTESTHWYTGEVIPAHDDESYMEGPKHLLDLEGYKNVLYGLAVPTEQMGQMGKDIIEGVPEEKRTMYESQLDLAIMPILGPLIGQKEYGIGTEEYRDWQFGFADPRNIFTDSMTHNVAVAAQTLVKPEYYEAVGHEMDISAKKFEKHKPYYIATTIGELPYFMLGMTEGRIGAKIATKAAAMGVRYTSGASGPIARTIGKDVGRLELAKRGEYIAKGIESAPTRFVEAVQRWKAPPHIGIRYRYETPLGDEWGGELPLSTLPNVFEEGAGTTHQMQLQGRAVVGAQLLPSQGTPLAALRMAKGPEKGAPGYRWQTWHSGRLKEWMYRRMQRKQKEQIGLINLFTEALPRQVPLSESFIVEKLGTIHHIPGAIAKAEKIRRADKAGTVIGTGTYKGTKQEFAAPGRYIEGDDPSIAGLGDPNQVSLDRTRGVYANFEKYFQADVPESSPVLPKTTREISVEPYGSGWSIDNELGYTKLVENDNALTHYHTDGTKFTIKDYIKLAEKRSKANKHRDKQAFTKTEEGQYDIILRVKKQTLKYGQDTESYKKWVKESSEHEDFLEDSNIQASKFGEAEVDKLEKLSSDIDKGKWTPESWKDGKAVYPPADDPNLLMFNKVGGYDGVKKYKSYALERSAIEKGTKGTVDNALVKLQGKLKLDGRIWSKRDQSMLDMVGGDQGLDKVIAHISARKDIMKSINPKAKSFNSRSFDSLKKSLEEKRRMQVKENQAEVVEAKTTEDELKRIQVETEDQAPMGYLKPTAALTEETKSNILDANALATVLLQTMKKRTEKDIMNAHLIGRTKTGHALPAPGGVTSGVDISIGLKRTVTPNFITEKFRPEDLIKVGSGYYKKGVSSQVQSSIWQPGGRPKDLIPSESTLKQTATKKDLRPDLTKAEKRKLSSSDQYLADMFELPDPEPVTAFDIHRIRELRTEIAFAGARTWGDEDSKVRFLKTAQSELDKLRKKQVTSGKFIPIGEDVIKEATPPPAVPATELIEEVSKPRTFTQRGGFQTGVDQAGSNISAKYPKIVTKQTGTAPHGYTVQGGKLSDEMIKKFNVKEGKDVGSPIANIVWRTKQNVADSDLTLIFGDVKSRGSALTLNEANRLGKHVLVNPTKKDIAKIIDENPDIKDVNIAGSRGTKDVGGKYTKAVETEWGGYLKALDESQQAKPKPSRDYKKRPYVPTDLFGIVDGQKMVREPSFRIWRQRGETSLSPTEEAMIKKHPHMSGYLSPEYRAAESKMKRKVRPAEGLKKSIWTDLDIKSGWDVLQEKYGTAGVKAMEEVVAPATPPSSLKQIREVFAESESRVMGVREPIPGKKGTQQNKDYNRFQELVKKIAEENKSLEEEQKLIGIGKSETKLDHMHDVSWYEIMHDPRYEIYREFFKPELPTNRGGATELVEKYDRTIAATTGDRKEMAQSKLRELGNKISVIRYGEEGPAKHKIIERKQVDVYSQGATGARKTKLENDLAELVKEDKKWYPDDMDKTSKKRRLKMINIENELYGRVVGTKTEQVTTITNVIERARTRFSDKVKHNALGKGWRERVRLTVPEMAKKQIISIEKRIAVYEAEKDKLVARSPIVIGPPTVIHKIDPVDYGAAAQISMEWRKQSTRVRHAGKGYPSDYYTIEQGGAEDAITWHYTTLGKKDAIAHGFLPKTGGSLSAKTKGKKEKVPWTRKLRTKEPKTEGVIIGIQAKTDDITAGMLLGSKTQDSPTVTKLIATEFDGTSILTDKKFRRLLGAKQVIIQTGQETVEKTTRPGSLYLKTMARRFRRSYQRGLYSPEYIEGKPTYYLSSTHGDAAGLTLAHAEKFLAGEKLTGKNAERHTQVLSMRFKAFGGQSVHQLTNAKTSLQKLVIENTAKVDSIRADKAEVMAKVERKRAATRLASAILDDENELDYSGYVTYTKKEGTPSPHGLHSNWFAFKKGDMDPILIRALDTDEITVNGVKTTTGAEAVKKLERIIAREKVHDKKIKELKEDEAALWGSIGREKGKIPKEGGARGDTIPAQMVPDVDMAGNRIPLLDANNQQIIGPSGKPKWKMTEKFDPETESDVAKKTRTVGVSSTPEQKLDWIEHERAQLGAEEYKGNTIRFERMRLKAEQQKKMINSVTGERTVDPARADAYIKDYDIMNRTLNEQENVRTTTQTLAQFIKDNPNWSAKNIPSELKLAKDRLKDAVIRRDQLQKEMSEAIDHESASFDLLQHHVDLLDDNIKIFRTRVQSMVVSEKYHKQMLVEGEHEAATAARGMPDAVIKKITELQIKIKKAKGSQRYTRRDRYVLGNEVYGRVRARTQQEKIELMYSKDFLEKQPVNPTLIRIIGGKESTIALRKKRAKIEGSIENDHFRLADLEAEKQGHLLNEIRMYAKLNLERKLYDKLKIIHEDPLVPEEVRIEASELKGRIKDLYSNYDVESLLRVAKEGDSEFQAVPLKFTKRVTMSEFEFNELTKTTREVKRDHTFVDPEKFIKINKDYKDILLDSDFGKFGARGKRRESLLQEIKELKTDFSDEYAKKEFAGRTNAESKDLRAERLKQKQDALKGVQWIKPKDKQGKTSRYAKPVRIERKITDAAYASEPGNVEGTIYQLNRSRNFKESTQDSGTSDVLSIKTLHESIRKRESALNDINHEFRELEKKYGKGAGTDPRWQKHASEKIDHRNLFGGKINLDSFPDESLFTTWTKHRYEKTTERMAQEHRSGELVKAETTLKANKERLETVQSRLTFVETLPEKWKNFSMESRGIVWKAHRNVFEQEIPRDKPSRLLHYISESGDGKEYIYTKGEFYELPEGYWDGIGSVESVEAKAVRALTVEEKEKLFPEPLQKLRRLTEEKRKALQSKVYNIEQKIGIEPSDAEKMAAIESGNVPGYIVANTPLAKLLDKVGIRGGTASRYGSHYTASSNVEVMGNITRRFLIDLEGAVERKGLVHGARQVTTKDYELYTPVKGSAKTKFESQHKLAKLIQDVEGGDEAGGRQIAGLRKERIYQPTTTLPETPTETAVGIEALLGSKVKQPVGTTPKLLQGKIDKVRKITESRKIDPAEEPFITEMGVKDIDKLEDVYPIPGVDGNYTAGGQRILGLGEEAKIAIRQHISYRYVRDVLGFKTKKGYGSDSGHFIDKEGSEVYQTMWNYEDVFLSQKEQLDVAIRRPTNWEKGQTLFGQIDTSHKPATRFRKEKEAWINVYEIPFEGVRAAEGRVFKGKLTRIQDMIYFRKFVEKEKHIDPYQLAEYQALLRAVRDEGIPLQKSDKKILKMKPKFSEFDVARKHIDDEMKLRFGSVYNARDMLDWDWRKMAEKDATLRPQANELRKIEALQDSKRAVNSKISKLQTRRRELEEKLNVTYDKTAENELQKDVWYRLRDKSKGPAKYSGVDKDKSELQKIYKDLEKKYNHVQNLDDNIFGYYKDPTTATGNYVHTLLRDMQPKPIWEKGEFGKRGKIIGYEETPFTGLNFDKPLATGEFGIPRKSKMELYHDWLTSDARTGVYTRNHPAVKAGKAHIGDRIVEKPRVKPFTKQEDTPQGRRWIHSKGKDDEYSTSDEAYKVTQTYDPTYKTHGLGPREIPIGEVNLGDEIDPHIISGDHIRALHRAILQKKLSKEGVDNTKQNIKQYQKELEELEKGGDYSDTPIGRARQAQHEKDLEATKRSLQRELNNLGIHRNMENKSNDYVPVDVSDIERGTYTVEKGKNVQAQVLATVERGQAHAPGAPALRPLTGPPIMSGETGSTITVPRGVGSIYPITEPVIPDAAAVLEQEKDIGVRAPVPIIQPRPQQVGDIVGVDLWLKDSSRMVTGAVLDLTTKEDAKNIFPHISTVGSILHTSEKGLVVEKLIPKLNERVPEAIKQKMKQPEPKFMARVVKPPRIRPIAGVLFGWLDPAERAKRLAKLRKKKKKKIAWAAPKRWFEGEGYYFKGGAAYTSFTKKEPRKVKRQDVKLGEQKWSESRTRSLFDVRPFKGRKINPYRDQPRKKVKKKQPKRSDMFGSTSTSRKGY